METNNTTATSNVASAESITKELKVSFTDNELQSIAINAMGRASEAGNQAIMRLGLAVYDRHLDKTNGLINYPNINSYNSGYSFGFFQWDFGQKENAKELIEAYNASKYVKDNPEKAIKAEDIKKYALILQQNRDVDLNGRNDDDKKTPEKDRLDRIDIRYHKDYKDFTKNINEFLATNDGYKFMLSMQERQYDTKLEPAMKEALSSPAIQNMSKEDAVVALAVYAKLVNQAGSGHTTTKAIKKLFEKESTTKDDTIEKIKEIHDKEDKKEVDKLILSGLDHTLEGTTLYNTLSSSTSRLGQSFRDAVKRDQFNISNFSSSPKARLVDTMFRHPDKALELIEAMENNKDMVIQVNDRIENEAYSVAVVEGNIVTLDNKGKGYRLYPDSDRWEEFDNNRERLLEEVNGKLSVTPMTMEKGDKGNSIKELQERINHLIDYENLKIEKIEADGNFGQKTKEAVQAIQKEYGLKDDGIVGKATFALIIDKVTISDTLEEYLKTRGGVEEINLQIRENWKLVQELNDMTDDDIVALIKYSDQEDAKEEMREKQKQLEQEEDNLHYHSYMRD